MAKRIRVDQALVERGLADDLKHAAALIMAGQVVAGDQRVNKPSEQIPADHPLRLKGEAKKYVSRGGDKLAGALAEFELAEAMVGATVLDVGASTGGFTDCCLQAGAEHVVALDVGTNQLAWELRQDPRVLVYEQTDIRKLGKLPDHIEVNFVVADVSFNSLARLAPAIRSVAAGHPIQMLLLIKPQFEASAHEVPDGGVVLDADIRNRVVSEVREAFERLQLEVAGEALARLPGRTGNQEVFLWLRSTGVYEDQIEA